jgi:lysophospholipase L1-like esterase
MTITRRSFSWYKQLLFSLLPLILLMVCIEGFLAYMGMGQPFEGVLRMWGAPMEMLEPDPFAIYVPRPYFREGSVVLNSLGCRDDEFNEKADLKILSHADSVGFGWGVPDYHNTYSEQLEKMLADHLAAKHHTVEVLNAGVPSYKLYQGYQFYLHKLADLADWNIIIVSFGWNEPLTDDEELEFIRRNPPSEYWLLGALRRQVKQLRTFNVLESSYLRHSATSWDGRREVVYDEYRNLVRNFIQTALARHAKVVFLTVQPREEDKGDAAALAMAKFNRIWREQAVPGKVIYVDTDPLFRKDQPRWYDNVHYNEKGHLLTAKALAEAIVNELEP